MFLSAEFDPTKILNDPALEPPRCEAPAFPSISKTEFLVTFEKQKLAETLLNDRVISSEKRITSLKNQELRHYYRLRRAKDRLYQNDIYLRDSPRHLCIEMLLSFFLDKSIDKKKPILICQYNAGSSTLEYIVGMLVDYTIEWNLLISMANSFEYHYIK